MVPILLQVPSGDIDSEISSVSGLAEQEVTFSKTQNSDTEAYLSFSNNEAIDRPVYVVDVSFFNRFEDLSFEQSPSPVYSKFQYDEELADCTSSHVSEIKLFKIYDEKVTECQTKGLKFKAQKYIYDKTVRRLYIQK